MIEDYPKHVAPPPELVGEWWIAWDALDEADKPRLEDFIASKAAQWGAGRELEACCEWMRQGWDDVRADKLRAARRPKPPSLKQQAIVALYAIAVGANDMREQNQDIDTIRRALESLPK